MKKLNLKAENLKQQLKHSVELFEEKESVSVAESIQKYLATKKCMEEEAE